MLSILLYHSTKFSYLRYVYVQVTKTSSGHSNYELSPVDTMETTVVVDACVFYPLPWSLPNLNQEGLSPCLPEGLFEPKLWFFPKPNQL